ncbi:MAG: S41 family peptidase [Cyclobacteriaceae bacterium]
MKNTILCVVLLTLPLVRCTPQPPKDFSLLQLQSDFDLYRKALEEAHPGLYRYHSKAQFDSIFNKTRKSLSGVNTLTDFYERLTPINTFIGCGHTRTLLPQGWNKVAKAVEKHLPFEFRVLDGKAILYKSHVNDNDFAPGSQLISIEQPFEQLAKRMLPVFSADGYVTTSRWKDMERNFSVFLQLLVKESGPYHTVLLKPDGKRIEKEIQLINSDAIAKSTERPDLEFEILNPPSTAKITVRSFSGNISDKNGTGFSAFLKASFQKIQNEKIQNLIIDVRGNGGGRDDYGSLLFSYLTNEPYSYYSYLEVNKPEFTFLEYTNQSESFVRSLRNSITEKDGRYFLNKNEHSCLSPQTPSKPTFEGNVYVLINGRSFSATAEFCAVTRFHERAIFIGEETSGGYEGNNSGGSILLTLPQSKIRLAIPTYKYVSAVDIEKYPKGRGILPHHEIIPTINGLANGTDEVMDYVLTLIK